MAFFTRLRIGRRLGLAFAVIVTLTLLAAVVALVELQEVGRRARDLTTLHAERTSLAYRWREGIVVNVARAQTLGVTTDPSLATTLNAVSRPSMPNAASTKACSLSWRACGAWSVATASMVYTDDF